MPEEQLSVASSQLSEKTPRRVAHPSFFCLGGVFVVTTRIPALAERGLERGHAAPVVSPFGLFAAHQIH